MLRPRFSSMNWPKGLGLDILKGYLDDDEMERLISEYSALPRRQRRIIIPSRCCARKVYLHYLWGNILSGKTTWQKTRKSLRKRFGSLGFAKATITQVRQNYLQREREIARGN